jgi:hypothetical protein
LSERRKVFLLLRERRWTRRWKRGEDELVVVVAVAGNAEDASDSFRTGFLRRRLRLPTLLRLRR